MIKIVKDVAAKTFFLILFDQLAKNVVMFLEFPFIKHKVCFFDLL